MEKKLIEVNIKDIIPYNRNPRKNDKAVDPVKGSIEQCGYLNPIVVDEDMVILAGHTRRKSLIKMGVEKVQVLQVLGLTEEDKVKYRLYDNKAAEISSWDYSKLTEELCGLDFGNMNLDWGLDEGNDNDTEFINKEYSSDKFDDEEFEFKCPECGFLFNK